MASVLLGIEHGEPIEEAIYCEVMFDENISGEVPEHRDFIYERAIPFLEKNGIKTTVLHSKMSYMDSFYRICKKGASVGKRNGWPLCGKCCIQRDCKLKPINTYMDTLGCDVVQYLGIACDEQTRLDRLIPGRTVSLLEKYHKTKAEAVELCKRVGLYSPVYAFAPRNGCFFCPNAKRRELRHLYDHHPDLWARLLECQQVPNKATELFNRNDRFDEIDARFQWEDDQFSLFDNDADQIAA